jgi:hypothetical protein
MLAAHESLKSEKLKERDNFENVRTVGRIVLNGSYRKRICGL